MLAGHGHGRARLAIVAFAATLLFAAAPFALIHHHHANPLDSDHCAICIFASGHVTPPSPPPLLDCPPTVIAVLQPLHESLPPAPARDGAHSRAPPCA